MATKQARAAEYAAALAKLDELRDQGALTVAQYQVRRDALVVEAARLGLDWQHAGTPKPALIKTSSTSGFLVAGGVIIAIVIIGLLWPRGGSQPSTIPTSRYTPRPATVVVYELDGSADGADLTMQTATGTSQQSGVAVPLTTKSGDVGITVRGFDAGDFVYFSAQNTGEDGDLTCRIKVNGVVISENRASGAYAIATCDGHA